MNPDWMRRLATGYRWGAVWWGRRGSGSGVPSIYSSATPVGRNGWSAREVCSGSPIAEPVPRRLVSASFENASRIRPCRVLPSLSVGEMTLRLFTVY